MIAHEQHQIVRGGSRDQGAEPLVEQPVDVGHLPGKRFLRALRVCGVVRGEVFAHAMLDSVGGDEDRDRHPPVRGVQEMLGRPHAGRHQFTGLLEEGFGAVPERGPGHPVDRERAARPGQVGGERLGVGERSSLREHAARHQLARYDRRGAGQRHVHHDGFGSRGGQVMQEGPLPDGPVGDRKLPSRPPAGLQDVVDAVVGRLDAGQE